MSEEPKFKSRGHRRKGGTHGSLSKAGKTRDHHPRRWDKTGKKSREGQPFKHVKKHKSPRCANRRKFKNRVVLDRHGNKNVTEGQRR